ncbi:hypothetical protein [Pseudonocardia adelaidensis]|uniref:Uncharacterized protein n=1 Tax=Pseudonocardia adelaidensis TaxID=648754 RepID=A0ABP9NII3_9PSEU
MSPERCDQLGGQRVFGYYPVEKHDVQRDGERTAIWDLMGKDAVLFHHAADVDPESMDSQYVRQSRAWFDILRAVVVSFGPVGPRGCRICL